MPSKKSATNKSKKSKTINKTIKNKSIILNVPLEMQSKKFEKIDKSYDGEVLVVKNLTVLLTSSTSTVTPTRVSEDSDWGVIPHRSKIASEAFDAVAKL